MTGPIKVQTKINAQNNENFRRFVNCAVFSVWLITR